MVTLHDRWKHNIEMFPIFMHCTFLLFFNLFFLFFVVFALTLIDS